MADLGSGRSRSQDLMIESQALLTGLQALITQLIDQDVGTLITTLTNTARDDVDNAGIVIELEHHEIHEGKSYSVCISDASAASLSVSFRTPETQEIHIVISYGTESASHLEIIEGTAITATTGTEEDIHNRDRNSTNVSTLLQNKSGAFVADSKVLIDATTAGGTVIAKHYNWVDKKVGAERRGIAERILKFDTQYEILLTSDDGAKGLHIDLNWYEP